MKYQAIASDYDGTLAKHGYVDESTIAGLIRWRESGRKLILVTGRVLEDLQSVFSHIHLFDWAVLENGALLYHPPTGKEKVLTSPPPVEFIQALKQRNVQQLGVGRVIVSTWRPHEDTVLQIIQELGLNMQIIFNKDAVMVLPSGLNKAVGLNAALAELGISTENTIGVGDAENDIALLDVCGYGVAVKNALPILQEKADLVTKAERGAGVVELIDYIITTDTGNT